MGGEVGFGRRRGAGDVERGDDGRAPGRIVRPTTAASATPGWASSAASTSCGLTR